MKGQFDGQSLTVKNLVENRKFKGDYTSFESNAFSVETGGFFLNTNECLQQYGCKDIINLILKLNVEGKPLSTVLYGAYYAIVYNKKNKELHVYNDLLSKHSLFYSYDDTTKKLFFSDRFFTTLDMVNEERLPYSIDELGIKMMLSHGIFYDELTYVREIKFLRPFDYLVVKDGNLEVKRIARQPMLDVSMDEASKEIQLRFTKAVKLQYQKNEENGYPQITTISGGMDSRSTFLYGLANGYTEQIGFCYGESTSTDYEYGLQLATKNNCSFFFHPIDNGNHLLERDEMCSANEAQAVYSGPSGAYECLKFFDTDKWGIIHTGLGGGEIMGDMRVAETLKGTERIVEQLKYRLGKGKKDRTWESFVSSVRCTDEEQKRLEVFFKDYNDFNEFQSLCDMRRCLNSQKMGQAFGVEYVSPFLYEDFYCYMLRIPYSLTKDRNLYLYWQKHYNPQQFETPSTFQMGCNPNNKLGYYAKRFYKYMVNRMGKKTKYDMNPEESWLISNPKINKEQKNFYNSDMNSIMNTIDISLYEDIENIWSKEVETRSNILTVIWALRKIAEK